MNAQSILFSQWRMISQRNKRSLHVNAWPFVADPNQQDKQRMAYTQDYKFKFNYCDGLATTHT